MLSRMFPSDIETIETIDLRVALLILKEVGRPQSWIPKAFLEDLLHTALQLRDRQLGARSNISENGEQGHDVRWSIVDYLRKLRRLITAVESERICNALL